MKRAMIEKFHLEIVTTQTFMKLNTSRNIILKLLKKQCVMRFIPEKRHPLSLLIWLILRHTYRTSPKVNLISR